MQIQVTNVKTGFTTILPKVNGSSLLLVINLSVEGSTITFNITKSF